MSHEPYKLPHGWRWVRLGEVCEVNPRRPPKLQRDDDASTTFVPMRAVDEGSGTVPRPEIVPYKVVKRGYTFFKEGDVLFAKITPCMQNGKHFIARGLIDGIGFGSTEFHVIHPAGQILAEWIHLYLRQSVILERAKASFTGSAGQQRVPDTFLRELWIPLPPLEEQRRIVARVEALMERVREARALRAKALEETEQLMPAVLAELFPRPDEPLPPNWRWVRLGDVCEHQNGVWGNDPLQEPIFPVVRSTEICGFVLDPLRAAVRSVPSDVALRYELRDGDILLNRSSGSPHLVGWPAIFQHPKDSRKYLFSNFMLRLRTRKDIALPWFVLYYLHSPIARSVYLQSQDTTSGLRNLRVREFMAQPLPLPPLEEQRRIMAYLDAVHARVKALKQAQSATEAELQRLEQAILDKAFRGEL